MGHRPPPISKENWVETLCEPPEWVESGQMALPHTFGLGITLNEAELRRRTIV